MKEDLKNESGMTLIESLFAMVIMLAGLLTTAQVLTFCVIVGKTYGRDAGQTTAAARDKMDELTAKRFTYNATTSTETVDPALAVGTGGSAGSIYPDAPQEHYADLINTYGYASPYSTDNPADDYTELVRQWKIENDSTGTIKKIIVSVRANKNFGTGVRPSTIMVTNKTRETE